MYIDNEMFTEIRRYGTLKERTDFTRDITDNHSIQIWLYDGDRYSVKMVNGEVKYIIRTDKGE